MMVAVKMLGSFRVQQRVQVATEVNCSVSIEFERKYNLNCFDKNWPNKNMKSRRATHTILELSFNEF